MCAVLTFFSYMIIFSLFLLLILDMRAVSMMLVVGILVSDVCLHDHDYGNNNNNK